MQFTGELHYQRHNAHPVRVGERRLLFHIPTSGLFELDEVAAQLIDLFDGEEVLDASSLAERTGVAQPQIEEALLDFGELDVLRPSGAPQPERRARPWHETPLTTLVLNVNTGCNLSCTYCYKEDLKIPAKGERLERETAIRGVDRLIEESGDAKRLQLVFFGGEPLTNLPLIREVVAYAEGIAASVQKQFDFSLTTNATLLRDDTIDYLDAHRVGITVSMDGPKTTHDRHRRSVGGGGTYEVVAKKVERLLARYRSRPVGARVTLARGSTDVVGIHRHLRDELGFFEVGFAPATSPDDTRFALEGGELEQIFESMKELGLSYRDDALKNRNNGFANLHQLMTDLARGHSRALPCGAGAGLLALDHAGDFHLCHRFTGSDFPTLGNVDTGVDRAQLAVFLERAADPDPRGCSTCRVRNLCAGGCYHESYSRYGDPLHPTWHYCDLLRDWIDFGIRVYAEISEHNPRFFGDHLQARRPWL
jgi:uncharacterized protein